MLLTCLRGKIGKKKYTRMDEAAYDQMYAHKGTYEQLQNTKSKNKTRKKGLFINFNIILTTTFKI